MTNKTKNHLAETYNVDDDHEQSNKLPKVFLITRDDPNAGFFAYVTFAMNQLILCEKSKQVPVVYFGQGPEHCRHPFYDPAYGENVWEYYFEPAAEYSYDDLQKMVRDPACPLTEDDITSLSSDESLRLHLWEPDSVFNYPYGYYKDKYVFDEQWYEDQRRKAHHVIQRYIKVKPHIQEKVEEFCRDHFQDNHVLGVHIRGTDKGTADCHPRLSRIVRPREYFPLIDRYTAKHGPCRIFVATDQKQFVEEMRSRYGGRIISRDVVRSDSIVNTFQKRERHGYAIGEEVLLDCLILSRCDFLLKCTSAVGEYAIYFNPKLRCIDVNHDIQDRFHSVKRILKKIKGEFTDARTEISQASGHVLLSLKQDGFDIKIRPDNITVRKGDFEEVFRSNGAVQDFGRRRRAS